MMKAGRICGCARQCGGPFRSCRCQFVLEAGNGLTDIRGLRQHLFQAVIDFRVRRFQFQERLAGNEKIMGGRCRISRSRNIPVNRL